MNLYLIAWNLPTAHQRIAGNTLREMISVYPQLDPDTFQTHCSQDDRVFIASMQPPQKVVEPRKYYCNKGNVVVTFSGLPMNAHDTFDAHCADQLHSRWSEVPQVLEGQYVVIRCDFNASTIELFTDAFGIEPVYCMRYQKAWLVSNSIRVLSQSIPQSASLDPLGISLLLNFGRTCSNRTLLSQIQLIQAAAHWKWEPGETEPRKKTHYPYKVFGQLRRPKSELNAKALAVHLTRPLQQLSRNFGNLEVQLTGGIDSRLVAGLVIRSKLPSRFYTFKHVSARDHHIASQIAKRFNLEHQSLSLKPDDVYKIWKKAWWHLLRQNSGFAGFDEIPFPDTIKLMAPVEQLKTTLWGSGGGIAKGLYHHYFDRTDPTAEDALNVLKMIHIRDRKGLLKQLSIDLAENYFKSFVDDCVQMDVPPIDIPDLFFLYYHLGRWPGITASIAMPLGVLFSPFATKTFIETVFNLPNQYRAKRMVHYQLIKYCEPKLHRIPYDTPMKFGQIGLNPWRRRIRKYLGIKTESAMKFEKSELQPHDYIETMIKEIRELCLSNNNDLIFQLVNRETLETITSSKTPSAKRTQYLPILNVIATICSYSSLLSAETDKGV